MKLEKVTFEVTSHYKDGAFRVFDDKHMPIRRLTEEDLEGYFLCLSGERPFVSDIRFAEGFGSFGYYVDDIYGREAIPIEELKEFYLITQGS